MKSNISICAVIMFALLATPIQAIDIDLKAGEVAVGKELLANRCRSCHNGKDAKKMSPSKKTIKQWDRYFGKDQAKLRRKMADFDSYEFSKEELEHIHRFLVSGALDSGNAQNCP